MTYEQKQRQKEEVKAKEKKQMMITVGAIAGAAVLIALVAVLVNVFGSAYPSTAVALAEDGSLHVRSASVSDDFTYLNWGGCRPITVPASARQDTDSEIVISSECMAYVVDMFEHWSAGDMSVSLGDFES